MTEGQLVTRREGETEYPIMLSFWGQEYCISVNLAKQYRDQLDKAIIEWYAIKHAQECPVAPNDQS